MISNPNNSSAPGDILYGSNNKNIRGHGTPHYIIYLGPNGSDQYSFLGGMLTTSSKHPDNIPLQKKYFVENDDSGQAWRVQYKNSLITGRLFVKSIEWQPFEKVGQLTQDGLAFVQSKIGHLTPEVYEGNVL